MFDQLTREISYSARGLMRDRSFTLTTVATLTVGLSLVTVVFAIFNAYVLRPYAVRDPYSLYQIRWSARDGNHSIAGREFRWSEYEEMRAREDLFDDALAERNRPVSWERAAADRGVRLGKLFRHAWRTGDGRPGAGRIRCAITRGGTRRGPQSPCLDAAVRRRSRDRRPHDPPERSGPHRRRRDAGGIPGPERYPARSLGAGDDARAGDQAGPLRARHSLVPWRSLRACAATSARTRRRPSCRRSCKAWRRRRESPAPSSFPRRHRHR